LSARPSLIALQGITLNRVPSAELLQVRPSRRFAHEFAGIMQMELFLYFPLLLAEDRADWFQGRS